MQKMLMPQTPALFAQIVDPAVRATMEQKLLRYIARGQWAAEALEHLRAGSNASSPASPSSPSVTPEREMP